MPNKKYAPKTNLVNYGPKQVIQHIGRMKYSRYRNDSVARLIITLGFSIFFIILLTAIYPLAGEAVTAYMGEQFGATVLAGITNVAAIALEAAVGSTIGASIADGAGLLYYKVVCQSTPSPEHRTLSIKEANNVLQEFEDLDPSIPVSAEVVQRISSNIIARAIAHPDLANEFLSLHELLFKGEIRTLMAHPEIRGYILEICSVGMDEESKKSLFDKYRRFVHLDRIKSLGLGFPKGSILFRGAVAFKDHIQDLRKYKRRRGRALFSLLWVAGSAGGLFYGLMYGLPSTEPAFEAFLENTIRLHHHQFLLAMVGSGMVLVGASIGHYLSNGIYKVYAQCRFGVSDYALSKLTNVQSLHVINKNMPIVRRKEDGGVMEVKVILNLVEVNQLIAYVLGIISATGIQHERALLDFLHGRVTEAFMHPRTGPLLIKEIISDSETRIALLEQLGYIDQAVDAARLEIVEQMRLNSVLSSEYRNLEQSNYVLKEQLDNIAQANVALRHSVAHFSGRERAASQELNRIHALGLAHPEMETSSRRVRRNTLALQTSSGLRDGNARPDELAMVTLRTTRSAVALSDMHAAGAREIPDHVLIAVNPLALASERAIRVRDSEYVLSRTLFNQRKERFIP